MIEEICLPEDRFKDNKLEGLKRKNFIYGKNGTGKSSITEAISNQYSDNYDIHIFQGFQSVVSENGELNAISLGEVNSEIQPKIDKQNEIIKKLLEDTSEPNGVYENTFSKYKKSESLYNDLNKEIEQFYSKAASEIKNNYTEWVSINYNKNNFKNDINNAISLSEEEILEYKSIVKQNTIKIGEEISFFEPEVDKLINEVNGLITKNITKTALLKFNSKEEMNWVKEGITIHSNIDKCAFCGSEIEEGRLKDLNSYFDDEIKNLENSINQSIEDTKTIIREIEKNPEPNKMEFYPKFHAKIDELYVKTMKIKQDYKIYLKELINTLEVRKENIFIALDELNIGVVPNFKEVKELYHSVYLDNKKFGTRLEENKQLSKKRLKLNEVSNQLISYEYSQKIKKLGQYEYDMKNKKETLDEQKRILIKEKDKLKKLMSQTIDEGKAVENINNLLKRLGNQSFSLVNVKNENQKGQYRLIGYDGKPRNIETLSTGEKNILAFLWFVYNLEYIEKNIEKQTIIVFDDPMNSNDDTVQYLIISKLQELLKNLGDRQLFILTHNIHFYLNVRYRWWNGSKSDKKTFHLIKNDIKTRIRIIENKDEDLKTSYDALWSEVEWLYNNKRPNAMLNSLRRIFETYAKFNKIDNIFFNDVESQKLFNVNSHSIDDLEADLNGKTEDDLMSKVEQIFKDNNALNHFSHYWKK